MADDGLGGRRGGPLLTLLGGLEKCLYEGGAPVMVEKTCTGMYKHCRVPTYF